VPSVWGELRRRNVFKVGAAYVVVAWLLIQVTDIVLPTFSAPEWVGQTITFVLILSFPVAVVLAWAYEVTPQGIKRTRHVPLAESIRHLTGQKLNYVVTALLVVAVLFLVVDNYLEDAGQETLDEETTTPLVNESVEASPPVVVEEQLEVLPNSVAVLPFDNLSPDPDNSYFAAGVHEEVLNQLAKLRNVNVISRTAVLRYADEKPPILEIASALNVGTVMEGSVRYAGNRVRVTTQLIDPETGAHLWSETYDREFEDIFAIESDIAMNIANALEAEFSPAEQARIEQIQTDSPAAYALYLRSLDADDRASRHRYLDQAITLDSDFALAYARKAGQYAASLRDQFEVGAANRSERADIERLVQENAERALELDPNEGQAYMALGLIEHFSWRWAEARQHYERALQLSPNNAINFSIYGLFNSFSGRHPEAIRAAERALELNPSPTSTFILGIALAVAGNTDDAVESLRELIESVPSVGSYRMWLAQVEIGRGNHAEALEELRIAEQLQVANPNPVSVAALLYGYGRLGRQENAMRLFEQLQEISASRSVGAGSWVLAHLGVGDTDEALDWLRLGVERIENQEPDEGYFHLMMVKTNAWSDPTLDTPPFRELRDRMDALLN